MGWKFAVNLNGLIKSHSKEASWEKILSGTGKI
jgi:hypothetical protein